MKVLLLIAVLAAGVQADNDNGRRCSIATLKGSYGYTITGTRPVPGSPLQFEQIIGVGVRDYDGQGGFTQVDTTKGASAGAAVDIPTSGTYSIEADCSGKIVLVIPGRPEPVEARFVVINKGKEIRWIVLSPASTMVSGHAVRI
jgi:hypothetical protein